MFNSNSAPFTMPVAPANSGGAFGGDGFSDIIALAIIAMIFGWNGNGNGIFGGGNRGGSIADAYVLGSDVSMLSRQLSDGFNSIDNALDRQNAGICDLGYTSLNLNNQTNMNLMQGFNAIQTQLADCCCRTQQNIKDVQYGVATADANIRSAIKDCCCDTEKQFANVQYNMATQNCATLQAIDKVGDRIIDYLSAEKAQTLRDENFALKLSASQAMQNNYLIGKLQPTPIPSFPANQLYGYYGTTIA